ncbi:conserved hypothetical protein [uncultured Desulfobacterium sp.]|uniref:Uncharacterized protein n=1 Tax=uncultured Desulfobacterium sp. TaxID=201089 RepID=A0A445MWG4_9BACT|nr:conserved hypothetical protein [uncultured Desulfobacterium sp.]
MSWIIKDDQWVYVVIHGPEGNEQLLGQQDEEYHISFVPVFLKKEEAVMNLNLLAREKDHKYDVQAMLYEDLVARISGQGYMLFVLDGTGKVLEKITV